MERCSCNNRTGRIERLLLLRGPLDPWRGDSSTGFRCIKKERDALLDFKSGLDDPGNRLSSWVKDDDNCCQWRGVRCNNRTGHVERLLLRAPIVSIVSDDDKILGGEIRPSLLDLTHLKHLDLSLNNFSAMIGIPRFLGSFKDLRYLNLSMAGFNGRVPPELGNLSTLQHLDLSCGHNGFISGGFFSNLEVEDTRWLSRLTSLRHLDMSFVWFKKASPHNWLHAVNMLPSILEIRLSECELDASLPSSLPHHNNFTSLSILDLSYNSFNSTIPEWLCNLTSLLYLDMSGNQLYGSILASLGNLVSLQSLGLGWNNLNGSIPASLENLVLLQSLDLSDNKLTGSIPTSLGNLVSLQILYLYDNNLTGHIPKTLGRRLSNLTYLDMGWNNLEGILTEEHFINLTKLKSIDISGNPSLALKVSSGWNPPFRLNNIYMGSCLLGPQFPAWLRMQENYTRLDMSNAWISDTIPDWFWNLSTQFNDLNISHNKISGKLQSLVSDGAFFLDLSDNLFSGPIPPSIWDTMPNLVHLELSMNHINDTIPLSICKSTKQVIINLYNNFLSGELPKCWQNTSDLQFMDLSNNNLSGELPFALSNCTQLLVLDLSHNRFNGSIPPGIGQSLLNLMILSLNSNMLSGTIPSQLSNLSALQILDLSHNQLSGFIPQSFGDFAAMQFAHNISGKPYTYYFSNSKLVVKYEYQYSLMLSMKGRQLPYDLELLSIVVAIDLSDNSLSGSIPKEVGNLIGLESLNLSGNQLSGEIIKELGELRQLETLDLSKNKLSGRIPASLSDIYFLSHLNLSYNSLTGRIPSGEQLQTLNDPSSYIGNDDLCGSPLIKKCPGDEAPPTVGDGFIIDEETEGSDDIVWIYSTIAPGFVVGLLAFFGVLALKRKWRIAYFRFIDYIYDTIYVAIAININKLKRGMPSIGNHGLNRRN